MEQKQLTKGDIAALQNMRNEAKKHLKSLSKNELINLLIGSLVDIQLLQNKVQELQKTQTNVDKD